MLKYVFLSLHIISISPNPSSKTDFLATARSVKAAIVKHMTTVTESMHNAPIERPSFKRRPSALALYAVCRHCPRVVWTHNHQVSLVSFTDKPTPIYIEQHSRLVAYKLDYTLYGQQTIVNKPKHSDK